MKTFKNISTTIFFFLLSVSVLWADIVYEQTARQVAINIYQERCPAKTIDLKTDEVFSFSENDTILCFIVNFSQPTPGFVVVSATDAIIPVLAYSFNGTFSSDNHPPQFVYFLESYKAQIKYVIQNNLQANQDVTTEWERLSVNPADFSKSAQHEQMGPLMQSTWNQSFPYNELCPGGALVGCVAVSMGQIMKYWSHPIQGEGSHSYYHSNYGTLSADFGATSYAYDSMPNYTYDSNLPMANLLYHCGVSVEMNYGLSGSGAYILGYQGAMNAMEQYFKFDPDMYYDWRYKYSDSAWHEKIFNEIDNYRPLIYTGSDWMTLSLHAWNLDGYELVGELVHFHMNWGWGGSYNGYYYLDDLTPGYSDFTMGQEAVFNIFPYATNLLTCYPQNEAYWTGTTNSTQKTETSIVYASEPEDGWMMFDVSSIPDGADIYAVIFNGYANDGKRPDWSLTPVSLNPLTASPAELHVDIVEEQESAYYLNKYENSINFDVGWRRGMLEGSIVQDLENALASDRFTMGIANKRPSDYYKIYFDGWNEDRPPFIQVMFAAYGSVEGQVTEWGTGLPLENMYVNIGRFKDTTDALGYYHFDKVPIGDYEILVEANDNFNVFGNPYFDQTLEAVIISDGVLAEINIEMLWAEIDLNPQEIELSVNPGEVYQESFSIINDGPGSLDYQCYVSPTIGEPLMDIFIEEVLDDYAPWGCAFDGVNLWITGSKTQYGDHFIYKLDKSGALLETFPQGTTSSMGMKMMTFDGTYLYSVDDFGFYRIDPADGSVEIMFEEADFPEDIPVFYSLVWVPEIGFITNYSDNGFVVFDGETGEQLSVLPNSEIYAYDMTYDPINNCLWFSSTPFYTFNQYSLETFSSTGLKIQVPELAGLSYQSVRSAGFATDLVEGKTTLFGIVYGNPDLKFFAIELETWLQLEENSAGVVSGESKASLDVGLKIDPTRMAEASRSIDVVLNSTAGENDTLNLTINNIFTHGSIGGYITEYGSSTPVKNATIEINGLIDISDDQGYYQFENIPIGYYPISVSSADFIDSSYNDVAISGPPLEYNIQLLWNEMAVNPAAITVNVNPDSELETTFSILNTGPGELVYNCEIVFPEKVKSPSILVVDKDLSCEELWGGEYRADEWYMFQQALDENGYSYTYFEVLNSWGDGPDLETMQEYDLVIWFTGEVDGYSCLTGNDEDNLADFLDDGGYLFLSSSDYLSVYCWEENTFYLESGMFAYDYLGIEDGYADQWNIFWWSSKEIEGVTGSLMEGLVFDVGSIYEMTDHKIDNLWNHKGIDMLYVDSDDPWGGPCAIQYDTENYKTVFSTASIANVEDVQTRAEILSRIVDRSDMAWLQITENQSGRVKGSVRDSQDVGLKFHTNGLMIGTYAAEILIYNNGPESPVSLPVILNVIEGAMLDLKVFLEGPFVETEMDPVMCEKGFVPLSQPFNVEPWNYTGDETVESIPNNQIIDWVLVDFRDATDAALATEATIIKQQAAFLLSDGSIVDLDGASKLLFTETVSNKLFIAIRHINHIGILSSEEVSSSDGLYFYDYSSDLSKVYGGDAGYKQLVSGICGMVAGDANADGNIDGVDLNLWKAYAGRAGIFLLDFNLDGEVNNLDKNVFWYFNREKQSQLPQ